MEDYDRLLNAIRYLRCYAFCVFGCKEQGDDLIERFLREYVATNSRLNGRSYPLALFKAFHANHTVCKAFEALEKNNPRAVEDALHTAVLALPVKLRQALILVRTMDFTHHDAAEIISLAETEVARNVNEAVDRLFQQEQPRQRSHDLERRVGAGQSAKRSSKPGTLIGNQ